MSTGTGTGTKVVVTNDGAIPLSTLVAEIQGVIQDDAYTEHIIIDKINQAVTSIAGGIYMPDKKSISPPLPDLIDYATVTTSLTLAYVSLPSDYQRNVFLICDSSGNKFNPPDGGDYYAYNLFLKGLSDKRMTESGSVYRVAVKGLKLYYQGIPAAAETIGLHFYRKPTNMVNDTDTPDGIPPHLQMRLIKHKVCADIYGEGIEDGQDNVGVGFKFHNGKFMEAMLELVEFIGIDAEPQYYGSDYDNDGGNCL
jgi:hypothetical protein